MSEEVEQDRMVTCENCGEIFEHADELEADTLQKLEVDESNERPRIRIGTGLRDVWRCKGCGKVLGVR